LLNLLVEKVYVNQYIRIRRGVKANVNILWLALAHLWCGLPSVLYDRHATGVTSRRSVKQLVVCQSLSITANDLTVTMTTPTAKSLTLLPVTQIRGLSCGNIVSPMW